MDAHEQNEIRRTITEVRRFLQTALDMGELDQAEILSRILKNLLDCTR